MRSTLAIAAIAIGMLSASASAQTLDAPTQGRYSFTIIDVPGAVDTEIMAVNNLGMFTGIFAPQDGYVESDPPGSALALFTGYVAKNGVISPFLANPTPLHQPPIIKGMNDLGMVVGWRDLTPNFGDGLHEHPFVYANGTATEFTDVIGELDSINNQGVAVGCCSSAAFLYQRGIFTPTNIGGNIINNAGDISNSSSITRSNGQTVMLDPPFPLCCKILAINDHDDAVGYYQTQPSFGTFATHAFLYQNATKKFTTIDVPGADNIGTTTQAVGINNQGVVVGRYSTLYLKTESSTAWHDHGFVFQNGKLFLLDVPGAVNTDISAVNEQGEITGNFDFNLLGGNKGHAFTAVPGPPTVTHATLRFAQ